MKFCTKCKIEKDEAQFGKKLSNKSGLDSWCKECCKQHRDNNKAYFKQYSENNKSRLRDNAKKWHADNKQRKQQCYLDNKEKICEQYREYYGANKDKIQAKQKKYYEDHRDEILSRQKLYAKDNRLKICDRYKRRQKHDALFKLKCNIRGLLYSVFAKSGYIKQSRASALLKCTYEELLVYMGARPDGKIEIDHICPCSQALNKEELVQLQHYSNLRWLPAKENSDKKDKKTPEGEEICKRLLGREWIDKKDVVHEVH